jgi:CheY-like chemotaxis protein
MITDDPVVLLVDDSSSDSLLMRTVFERAGFLHPLHFARSGDEAIAYLRGDGRYADRRLFPLPTTLLMDLNMPGKNGLEVLDWIRHQPYLRRLQVYILSASSRPEDIQRSYDLGANSYLVKPGNFDGLLYLVNCLIAWLKLSHFAPPLPVQDDFESVSPFLGASARTEEDPHHDPLLRSAM